MLSYTISETVHIMFNYICISHELSRKEQYWVFCGNLLTPTPSILEPMAIQQTTFCASVMQYICKRKGFGKIMARWCPSLRHSLLGSLITDLQIKTSDFSWNVGSFDLLTVTVQGQVGQISIGPTFQENSDIYIRRSVS